MKRKNFLLFVLVLLLAVTLAACGGGDYDEYNTNPTPTPDPEDVAKYCGNMTMLADNDVPNMDGDDVYEHEAVLYELSACGYKNVICFVSDEGGTAQNCYLEEELLIGGQ